MSNSEEEVLWCYRHLLGREPESAAALRGHMSIPDFRSLVKLFVQSNEFALRQKKKKEQRAWLPPDLPKDDVEVLATPKQLAASIAHIKKTWTHLGSEKAHFSVLTNETYLPENLDGAIEGFWATGELEAAKALKMLERHDFGDLSNKIGVEYGCGVGRVTMGFAGKFAHVHGYDISTEHLEHANRRATEIKAGNLSFHECSGNILEKVEPCDFYYSRIVFQHNPPPIIYHLVRNALKSLKPNGVAIFQVPTYRVGYRFKLDEWLAAEHKLDMQMHCLPQQYIFELIASENCLPLDVREDNSTGSSEFISNMFVVQKRGASRTAWKRLESRLTTLKR